jgi:hypothetical protein
MKEGTPLITTVPYIYEAFRAVHEIDGKQEWLDIMQSVARHAFEDYHDIETSATAASCSYTPDPGDLGGVVNASAYRALLLTRAALDFSQESYRRAAERNINFVLQAQNADGSWYYSTDGSRDFVDHFHTCFVLKALAKIEALTGNRECTTAIDRGVSYYTANLFDSNGLPKPFSRAPRLTVYRHELYDYAECINLAALLRSRYQQLDALAAGVVQDLLLRWRKRDGSFRSRKLYFGWDNLPMHRWAQAQLFRSLAFLLYQHQPERLASGTAGRCYIDAPPVTSAQLVSQQ